MTDLFYRAFEERYRGSRALIASRLGVYKPFIAPFQHVYPESKGLDIGCGRGEWLEILREENIDPVGVDLDEGMLEACRALQLPVIKDDAVDFLKRQPSESLVVISAFHVVEHIEFEQLQVVVSEALRVLKPGGLLILETPNPENLMVGSSNFYLDPSHQRPIPSQLLSFLPEYVGFFRTKVLRLQEPATLLQQTTLGIHDVLTGVSLDYAVVAQKDALATVLSRFDASFSREHGLSLSTLTSYYDAGIRGPMRRIETRQNDLETQLAVELKRLALAQQQELDEKRQTHAHLNQVALDVQQLHQAFHGLRHEHELHLRGQQDALHRRLHQTELRAERAELELYAVAEALRAMQSSTFWRLLVPVRWCAIQLKLLATQGPLGRLRALGRKFGAASAVVVSTQTHSATSTDVQPLDSTPIPVTPSESPVRPQGVTPSAAEPLSARVEQIHRELAQALNHSDGPR